MTTGVIQELIGDATLPQGNDSKIIAHIVNDIGKFGAGFTASLTLRFKDAPRRAYHRWCHTEKQFGVPFRLGETVFVELAGSALMLAHMLAQHGVGTTQVRVDYAALKKCLEHVFEVAVDHGCSVHMPRIGTGLGGGNWLKIRSIIEAAHQSHGDSVNVFIYTLDEVKP